MPGTPGAPEVGGAALAGIEGGIKAPAMAAPELGSIISSPNITPEALAGGLTSVNPDVAIKAAADIKVPDVAPEGLGLSSNGLDSEQARMLSGMEMAGNPSLRDAVNTENATMSSAQEAITDMQTPTTSENTGTQVKTAGELAMDRLNQGKTTLAAAENDANTPSGGEKPAATNADGTPGEPFGPEDPKDTAANIDTNIQNPAETPTSTDGKDTAESADQFVKDGQRIKELTELEERGDLTVDQMAELKGLRENQDTEKTNEQELTMEQLREQVDQMGEDLLYKGAHGELSPEEFEKANQEFRDKAAQLSFEEKGFTREQAQSAVKEANKRTTEHAQGTHTEKMNKIQEKIQELMVIEYQILSIPKTVAELRGARQQAVYKAEQLHAKAQAASAGSPERMNLKAQEYNQYMVVENYNMSVAANIHLVDRLNEKRRDLEQQVRSEAGVVGVYGAIMEWGANRVINTVTELRINAEDKMDYLGKFV